MKHLLIFQFFVFVLSIRGLLGKSSLVVFTCRLIDKKVLYNRNMYININTPGTAGGPGGRDQTLAVKNRRITKKISFSSRKKIKITKKNIFFTHGSFSEVGQKQKTEIKRKKKKD